MTNDDLLSLDAFGHAFSLMAQWRHFIKLKDDSIKSVFIIFKTNS